MATKTYPQLTAETTVEDADLLATWRGVGGPLKRITALLLKNYISANPGAVTISAKSANYTVLTTDIGKTFNCTGTFTLALTAAATLGSGFFFNIKNTGTGVITIDPSSSELIDGRSTICVYPGEGFQVTGTGSAFITEGRSSRVRLQATYTVSPAAATVEFTQGWGDTEFTEFTVDYLVNSTATSSILVAISGGGYGNHSYSMTSLSGGSSAVSHAFGASGILAGIAIVSTEPVGGRATITQSTATTKAVAQISSAPSGSSSESSLVGGGQANLSSALDAIKFLCASGNVGAGSTFDIWGQR